MDRKQEDYKTFIIRRFFRLAPIFYVSYVIYLIVHSIYLSIEVSNAQLTAHLFAHLTLMHGAIPNEILPHAATKFLVPAWSISTEWQFYLLAPLPFVMMRKYGFSAITMVSGALGLFLVFKVMPVSFDHDALVFLKAPLFLMGICSYYLYKTTLDHREALRPIAPYVVPVTLAFASVAVYKHGALGVLNAQTLWALFMAFILSDRIDPTLAFVRPVTSLFRSRALMWLGAGSYSTYLIHESILAIVDPHLRDFLGETSRLEFAVIYALIVIPLIIVTSRLMYVTIERRGIRFGSRLARRIAS
jgi:peptidoglycan/LPS O-acetylase OafA/YrhL